MNPKTIARFGCLLRPPAWKWGGPILVCALHKYVTCLLTSTLTHLLTASGLTWGDFQWESIAASKSVSTHARTGIGTGKYIS